MDLDGYRLTAASHVTADFTVGGWCGGGWEGGWGCWGCWSCWSCWGCVFSVDLHGLADCLGKMKLSCKVRRHFEMKRDACKLELGNGYIICTVIVQESSWYPWRMLPQADTATLHGVPVCTACAGVPLDTPALLCLRVGQGELLHRGRGEPGARVLCRSG